MQTESLLAAWIFFGTAMVFQLQSPQHGGFQLQSLWRIRTAAVSSHVLVQVCLWSFHLAYKFLTTHDDDAAVSTAVDGIDTCHRRLLPASLLDPPPPLPASLL